MITDTTFTAIWTPGWYELDQTLVLGERQKFWFFDSPLELKELRESIDFEGYDFVFFNQLDSSVNCCIRYAKIVEIFHPQLGYLLKIDTEGLDYIFYPVDGEELIVNAEENPGEVSNEDGTEMINDWTVYVKLTEVSEPFLEPI